MLDILLFKQSNISSIVNNKICYKKQLLNNNAKQGSGYKSGAQWLRNKLFLHWASLFCIFCYHIWLRSVSSRHLSQAQQRCKKVRPRYAVFQAWPANAAATRFSCSCSFAANASCIWLWVRVVKRTAMRPCDPHALGKQSLAFSSVTRVKLYSQAEACLSRGLTMCQPHGVPRAIFQMKFLLGFL